MSKQFKPSVAISTLGYIGFIKGAPGTWGSLVAAALWLFIPGNPLTGWALYTAVSVLIAIVAIPVCTKAEVWLGHDNGSIIIDELAGYAFSVLLLPRTWQVALAAFVLFRLFDITKPYPVNKLQNLPKGLGVVADDLAAGIIANLLLQLAVWYWPNVFGIL